MELKKYKNFYFIGIGGIGMSALARYFSSLGKKIFGYDRVKTGLTHELEKESMFIHYEDDIKLIPVDILNQKDESLVIYTPAIPADHLCLNFLRENGYDVFKRAMILGEITLDKFTIAVGGTHGKTTTSAMIAHVLKSSGVDCYALLGGISVNYNSNFILPENGSTDIFVVEADEYDKSFLELSPDVLIITSTDADHLDIYHDQDNILHNYHEFALRLKKGGTHISREGLVIEPSAFAVQKLDYGFSKDNYVCARNITIKNNSFYFDLESKTESISGIRMAVPGEHNILNSLATYCASRPFLKSAGEFKKAIESFSGVKRRFEYILNTPDQVFIDDYAHHPVELAASISTIKTLYPGRKITGIFQPHLYTRTRDFYMDFAKSLSVLDKVILLDIYPAREMPITGVTSEMIFEKLTSYEKLLMTNEDLLKNIKKECSEVLITFGAGDIDKLVQPIKNILSGK